MLDPFGIDLGGFRRHADRKQEPDHDAVAFADALRHLLSGLGEENPAIRPRRGEAFPLESRDRLVGGRMSDAECTRDLGRSRLSLMRQKIGDQFRIIFQNRRRTGGACLAEALRWIPLRQIVLLSLRWVARPNPSLRPATKLCQEAY